MSDRELNKYEVGAMWVYGDDYSISRLSATQFWQQLSHNRKRVIVDMIDEILAAPFGTWTGARKNKVSP